MKKNFFRAICFILKINFFCPFLFSQTNFQFLSATTGAGCYEVCVYGNYLFAGAGNTLMVFDASTGTPPMNKLFEHRFTSHIDNIEINGSKMFVAANHAGLSMWNITNPASPVLLDEYIPDSLNEAAYNIAFFGDTVFLAYKSKMAIFKDNGNSISLLGCFAYQTGVNTRVRGCAVKGNLLAFTVAYGTNPQTGVYIYNASTVSKLSFYQQNYCDPEEVEFGKNTNLLHVAGGTESLASFGLDAKGLFYSLDISNPALPLEVFRDTIPGIPGLAIAMPMNIVNKNDTIFVATEAALDANFQGGDTVSGQIYVYDAVNQSNVHLINSLNAGLWHFDMDIKGDNMFVASEWYGVKTVEISDLLNEVNKGNTLTGGWNLGSDKFGDRMIVGNEGFGMKLFDIANPQNPVLVNSLNTVGFCMDVNFSKNGNYIFGWFWTVDDFRVYDANTLNEISSLPIINSGIADYFRSRVWNDKVIAIQKVGNNKSIISVDVSNPFNPFVDTSISINNILDMTVDENGKIFVATKDSLFVLDINAGYSKELTVLPALNLFNDFVSVAKFNDTLFAYVSGLNGGIIKYRYNGSNQLVQILSVTHQIPNFSPKFLAVDSFGLYLCYVEQGLFSFNKNDLTQTGYYRHGMEFVHNFLWGPQDIFCKDNLIFLVEYMGQTTILSNNDNFNSAESIGIKKSKNVWRVFPNPGNGNFILSPENENNYFIPENGLKQVPFILIYNIFGEIVYQSFLNPAPNSPSGNPIYQINLSALADGLFTYKINSTGTDSYFGKLLILH